MRNAEAGAVEAFNFVGSSGDVAVDHPDTGCAFHAEVAHGAVVVGGQFGVATLSDARAALEASVDRAVVADAVGTAGTDVAGESISGDTRVQRVGGFGTEVDSATDFAVVGGHHVLCAGEVLGDHTVDRGGLLAQVHATKAAGEAHTGLALGEGGAAAGWHGGRTGAAINRVLQESVGWVGGHFVFEQHRSGQAVIERLGAFEAEASAAESVVDHHSVGVEAIVKAEQALVNLAVQLNVHRGRVSGHESECCRCQKGLFHGYIPILYIAIYRAARCRLVGRTVHQAIWHRQDRGRFGCEGV